MPPCLNTSSEGSKINETEAIYRVVNLNESVTMETSTVTADHYDGVGAMQFIICTVSVYSFLGVFFLLVIRFRQGTTSHKSARTQADAINNYLKTQRSLKIEGYKMKMLKEIEKHVVSIDNFEQKMKLLEIEKDVKTEDFGLGKGSKSKSKKAGKRKQFQVGSRRPLMGKRRLSAPEAFGRIGFSVLFMEPKEETLQEEDEELSENITREESQKTQTDTTEPEVGKAFADIHYTDA